MRSALLSSENAPFSEVRMRAGSRPRVPLARAPASRAELQDPAVRAADEAAPPRPGPPRTCAPGRGRPTPTPRRLCVAWRDRCPVRRARTTRI
jgi:hypothetical protein